MRRQWVYIAAVGSPAVAASMYAVRFGGFTNAYYLSILLGVAAYTWACNQFVLAARPHVLVSALGKRRLRALHARMSVLTLVAAALHGLLKVGLLYGAVPVDRPSGFFGSLYFSLLWGQGFRKAGPQAVIGELGLLLLLAGLALAGLFLASERLLKLKLVRALRGHLFERAGAAYRQFRRLHLFWAAVAVVYLVHILVASSTSFVSNPVAACWLLGYFLACISVFAVGYSRRLGAQHAHKLRAVGDRLRRRSRA